MYSIRQKVIIILTVAVVLVLIAAVALLFWNGFPGTGDKKPSGPTQEMKVKQGEEAAKETQKLIDDVKKIAEEAKKPEIKPEEKGYAEIVKIEKTVTVGTTTTIVVEEAALVAPGTSPISLETGEVVDGNGQAVTTETMAGAADAPQQSYVLDNPDKLPESTIKLAVTISSITPAEFRVKAGQAISLSVTTDSRSHILKFDEPSLSAVIISLAPGQTRAMTFNAPAEPGEYVFYSDIYRTKGASCKMIVE